MCCAAAVTLEEMLGCFHNNFVTFHRLDSDFSVIFLRFRLELNTEEGNLGLLILLGLHFKQHKRKSVLELGASRQPRDL